MNDIVKPKRRYASTRRALQAGETREAILAAAGSLFVSQGWSGTTIAAIARDAGVSAETVYAVFGQKRTILRELIRLAVRGQAANVPLLEQAEPAAVLAAESQRAMVRSFAPGIARVLSRVAPLIDVVRTAAASDADMAALYGELHAGRRRNLAPVAAALAELGPLRGGMEAKAATDALWRLASPELFLLMTRIEGMSLDAYGAWLSASLTGLLVED